MLVGELVELLRQNPFGTDYIGSLRLSPELQQQALAQVPGTHSGRFELLDYSEQLLNFFLGGFDSRPEGQVVHHGGDVAAQVAVGVEAADYELPYLALPGIQVAEPELVDQTLGEALLYREGVVFRTWILAPVGNARAVGGHIVVILYFIEGNILRGLVVAAVAVLGRTVVEDWILFQLGAYPLLQLLNRQLYELDGLDLERRKPLSLLEFQSLFLHGYLLTERRNFSVSTLKEGVFSRAGYLRRSRTMNAPGK